MPTTGALAQTFPPVSPVERERAQNEAERAAAERAARIEAPNVSLDAPAGAERIDIGPIPEGEDPCFPITSLNIAGADHAKLAWARNYGNEYVGRCLGAQGLDHILRNFQAEFLDRGLITTRVGMPEQDLGDGSLDLEIVPGIVGNITTNGEDRDFSWSVASPVDEGDLVTLRGLEQAIEQLRRIRGRTVDVQIEPGERVGESVLAVTDLQDRHVGLDLSIDNYAGSAVGHWQGSAYLSALNLLGMSEIATVSVNRRIDEPGIPADSRGIGANVSVPFGWWTAGLSGSYNRYSQRVFGEVADFGTVGKQYRASGFLSRVLQRDQTSKTDLTASLTRRWSRNFIENVEIVILSKLMSDSRR